MGLFTQCRQDTNLDCNMRVRAGSHREKETRDQTVPLRNSTDFKYQHI